MSRYKVQQEHKVCCTEVYVCNFATKTILAFYSFNSVCRTVFLCWARYTYLSKIGVVLVLRKLKVRKKSIRVNIAKCRK